jgi:WD40 repeat protein
MEGSEAPDIGAGTGAGAGRAHRRVKPMTIAVAALFVVATIGSWFAGRAKSTNSAEEDRKDLVAERLGARAAALRPHDARLALQLDIAAERLAGSRSSRSRLLKSVSLPYSDVVDGGTGGTGSVVFAPDGKTMMAMSHDGLRVWDVDVPGPPRPIGQPWPGPVDNYPGNVALSPDGRLLVTGGDHNTLLRWDFTKREGRPLDSLPLPGTGFAHAVVFSPDGRTLATGTDDGLIRLWNVGLGGGLELLGAPFPADSTQPPPDLAAGTFDTVWALVFSPDGRRLVSASGRGVVKIWGVSRRTEPKEIGTLPLPSAGTDHLAFSPDGHTLVSGDDNDPALRFWDVKGQAPPRLIGDPVKVGDRNLAAFAVSPMDGVFAAGNRGGQIYLWDMAHHTRLELVGETLDDEGDGPTALVFSPDGKILTAGDGLSMAFWRLPMRATPTSVGRLQAEKPVDALWACAVSPDGHTLATVGEDGTTADGYLSLWDIADRLHPRPLTRTPVPTSANYDLQFVTNRRLLSVTEEGREGGLSLWDITDRTNPRATSVDLPRSSSVTTARLAPDGVTLASVHSDGTLRLWTVADDGKARPRGPSLSLPGDTALRTVAFFLDGRHLAVGADDGTVRVWDLADLDQPKLVGTGGGNRSTGSLTFFPDGRTAVVSAGDGTAGIWDFSDPARPLRQDQPLVVAGGAVAIAPDGETVAVALDYGLRLWDVADREQPVPLGVMVVSHDLPVRSVAFTPDGRTVVTVGSDGAAQLWDIDELIDLRRTAVREACSLVGAGLDPEQWKRFVPEFPYRDTCAR